MLLRASPEVEHFFAADGSLDTAKVRAERLRRALLYERCNGDAKARQLVLDRCRAEPVFFINSFCWTYDPRFKMKLPMVLWARQRAYIEFVEAQVEAGEEFVTEKSRDVGVTYMHAAMAVHYWRFEPGYKTTFCANKLDLVDKRGNPDSIFEKIRRIVDDLPRWVKPAGFRMAKCAKECLLINPENGNVISGEGGDNAGRGGRATLYVVDEAAHVDRADSVNSATSATARCRGWTSSVNGNGNLFYRFAHDGDRAVFRFHWRDDPRKNEAWAAKKRRDLTPEVFAQEYDLDYGASITGLAIPMRWVDAARDLYRRFPEAVAGYQQRQGICGVDVGGGKAECVAIPKWGPVIGRPVTRLDPDSMKVGAWVSDVARTTRCGRVNYDAPGVGFALGSILNAMATVQLDICAVNTGMPPTQRQWPDGRTSQEKYVNLKAELWMRAREAFNKSWLRLRFLDGDSEGIDYPDDEVIFLADDDELARQLSTPKRFQNEAGKIMLETKDQLAKRGIPSPDRADAAILAFYDDRALFYVGRD